MARSILAFILLIALLSACGSVPSTLIPTVTATPSSKPTSTPTFLNTGTPTVSVTPEVEKNQIEFEIIEENRKEINRYTRNILFTINSEKKYFDEFNIQTIQDFEIFMQNNNNILPKSTKGNNFFIPGLYGGTDMRYFAISMESPLNAEFSFEFTQNPNDAVSAIVYPNFTPPIEKQGDLSVAMSIGTKETGNQRQIVLQVIWRDTSFNLEGRKLKPTDNIPEQTDQMFRSFLYMLTALGRETTKIATPATGTRFTVPDMEISQIITKKGGWISEKGGKAIGLSVPAFFDEMQRQDSNQKIIDQMPPQIVEAIK